MICLLTVTRSSAESPSEHVTSFVHQQWTKKQGLPDNQVNAILQGQDGYVWLATKAGLARFDGARFVAFNRANALSLVDDNCTALAENTFGGFLVETPQGLST